MIIKPESASSRIARNTFLLYARSFLVMLISLYSSRVILTVLGVEGYGVYSLVGGVVGLFGSLRGVFASSIQRFINFTRGEGNEAKVQHVFALGFWIHVGLAILFFSIVSIFGVWFIPTKLVLPAGMLNQAMFVFWFSLAAAVVSIIGVPYDALIIANERMSFYAYVAIFDSLLKLAILFLLPVLPSAPLITYAVLLFIIVLALTCIKIVYCKQFPEKRITRFWDKKLFKDIASFSGWNFFGNMVFTLINEGANLVLNMFGGVVANAARGLAYQVKSAFITLSNNVITASEPYIMQQAASVGNNKLFQYVFKVSRAIFYIMIITAVPIFVYAHQILSLWLKNVPEHTEVFVRIILVHVIIRSLHNPINTIFSSVAKLKNYQIGEFVVGVLELPVMYLFLFLGFPLYTPFIIMIIWEILNLFVILKIANCETGLDIAGYFRHVLFKCLKACAIVVLFSTPVYFLTCDVSGFAFLVCVVAFSICLLVLLYLSVFDRDEKVLLVSIINRINRHRVKWDQ